MKSLGWFWDLELLVELFTAQGLRRIVGFLLMVASGLLVMCAAIYVIYGRGPTCVISFERVGPRHKLHWQLKTGADLKALPPENACSTAAP